MVNRRAMVSRKVMDSSMGIRRLPITNRVDMVHPPRNMVVRQPNRLSSSAERLRSSTASPRRHRRPHSTCPQRKVLLLRLYPQVPMLLPVRLQAQPRLRAERVPHQQRGQHPRLRAILTCHSKK